MEKAHRFNLTYLVLALFAVFLVQDLLNQISRVEEIPYSRFVELADNEQVTELVVGSDKIRGSYVIAQNGKTSFVTQRVDPDLSDLLSRTGVSYTGAVESTWIGTLASWFLPVLLFFGLWYFLMRRVIGRQGFGGAMAIGQNKAKIYVETDTKVTFEDVAGVDEAKEELRELIEFLRAPQEHGVLGARAPKGVLLLGPPGTGKTLLARAVAGEAGVPFFSISGSEFVEMFVGVGAARVRDLFEKAREQAPAIIFIDELDALGRARGVANQMGGHDEREQTLNQLLTELDGFDASAGVVLLAATNRPEILDPALLRAGRFDRQVLIDRPDKNGREAILRVHMKKARIATGVDPAQIAALTTGFTGADLANLVNEAALLATRRRADAVDMTDFTRAIERILAGLERKNRVMNPREREIVAVHEMGHALTALCLPGTDKVHKVSIIPRGVGALGYTIQRPTEDRYLMTRKELENKIAVLLGGRAAEHIVFDHFSTGAADDLAKATDIARSMAVRYGMEEDLGHVAYDAEQPNLLGLPDERRQFGPRPSERTSERIDNAVSGILDRAFEQATDLLTRNRHVLDRSAEALLERETLDEQALAALTGTLKRIGPTPPLDPAGGSVAAISSN